MKPFEKHMAAIRAGRVEKTNVTGMRKMLNAFERDYQNLHADGVIPTKGQVNDLLRALRENRPLVTGPLHDSGMVLLKNKRYRRQLAPVADILPDLCAFRLIGFDGIGRWHLQNTPVYEAVATTGRAFKFRDIPWQSGGHGPELL